MPVGVCGPWTVKHGVLATSLNEHSKLASNAIVVSTLTPDLEVPTFSLMVTVPLQSAMNEGPKGLEHVPPLANLPKVSLPVMDLPSTDTLPAKSTLGQEVIWPPPAMKKLVEVAETVDPMGVRVACAAADPT